MSQLKLNLTLTLTEVNIWLPELSFSYTKRCRQVQENHEEDNGPVAVEREDNGHVAVEREDNGAVAVRRMDDDQYEILLQ